jgi:hypothetical protein
MPKTLESIMSQVQAEKSKVQDWQSKQSRSIEEEARRTRETIRKQISRAEKEAQDILEATRRAKAKEAKRRELGIEAEVEKYDKTLKDIEKLRKEAISEGYKAKVELGKSEKEVLAKIEQKASEALGEIEKASKEAVKKYEELKKDNVELDTGEWIDKDAFKDLSKEDQKLIIKVGVKEFNKTKEKLFKETYIETGKKDEWVNREFYDSLTKEEQKYLRTHSISEFNHWAEREFKEKHKQLKTGEWIDKKEYEGLSPEQQGILYDKGIEGFQKYYEDQFYDQYVELCKDTDTSITSREKWDKLKPESKQFFVDTIIENSYVLIGEDEHILRSDFEDLPEDEQKVLKNEGFEALEKYVDNKYITTKAGDTLLREEFHSLPFETQQRIDTMGLEGYQKWIDKNYQTLNTGELIEKSSFNILPPAEQQYLRTFGVDKWNAEFNKQLATGEWVNKESFEAMPYDEQKRLNKLGTKGYQSWLDSNFIKLDTGEYYPLVDFNSLSTFDQKLLKSQGIDSYNKIKDREFKAENTLVGVDTEEPHYVSKENYNSLSLEDRQLLKSVGIAQFNQIKDKELQDFIDTLPQESQDFIARNGIEAYNQQLERIETEFTDIQAFGALKGLGHIPQRAELVGKNDKGELEYTIPAFTVREVKAVGLDNFDVNDITLENYRAIAKVCYGDKRYRTIAIGTIGTTVSEDLSYTKYIKNLGLPKAKQKELLGLIGKRYLETTINVFSLIFPPAQALRPDVTLKDISRIDWAIGAANVALIIAVPALGAIGRLTGATGKVVSTVGKTARVAGQIVKAGAVATFPVVTAISWKDMTATQQAIAVALNVAIVGVIYGRPLTRGLKTIAGKIKGSLPEVTKTIDKLSKAVKAGNIAKVKALSKELETLGLKIKGIEGKVITEQARFINRNASVIVKQTAKMPKGSTKYLDQINKDIARLVKSGASGGTISKLPKELFKKADVKPKPEVARQPPRVKIITREALGKTAEQYKRFLRMRIQQWAERGAEPSLAKRIGLTQRVQRITPSVPKTLAPGVAEEASANLLRQIAKEAGIREALQRILANNPTVREALKKIGSGVIVRIPKPNVAPANWQPTLIVKLTKEIINKLIAQWKAMSPSKALQQMLEANLVTVALATNAGAIINIISRANVKLQNRVKSIVSPEIKEAIEQATRTDVSSKTKTANITKAQTLAKTETGILIRAMTKLQSQVKQLAKTLTETKVETKALTKAQVKTQALAKTKAITKAATKAVTKVVTRATTKAKVQEQVKQAVAEQVKAIPSTAVKEAVKTNIATIVSLVTANVTRLRQIKPPPYIPRIRLPDGSKRAMTPEEMAGAVAWKQGFIYKMLYPPYDNMQNSRKPFPGIKIVKGVRSAYKTIIRLGGRVPARIAHDMGIMDVFIITPKKGKPRIEFKRDIKQKTQVAGISMVRR